ncbi:hypothetical protein [Aeromicrobium sp.]|uniref:hypothetical protein n=1 Tax=Aeromicrobium sp. TaxID=1871063 RepID=UPI002FC6881A
MSEPSYAWRPAAILALRRLAVASLAGAIVGFLAGGVGGRLAMSLLASLNPEDAGVVSDDGFTMGQVTLNGTLNLLLVGTLLGVLGGGIYLAVRDLRIGPAWFRAASLAVGVTVVVGAGLVHSDGVDFTLLEPTYAAIGLTLAMPFVYALALPPLADRLLRDDSTPMTTTNWLVFVPLVPWVFPLTPAAAVLVLGWVAVRALSGALSSRARALMPWIGRLALTAVFAVGLAELVQTTREIYRIT